MGKTHVDEGQGLGVTSPEEEQLDVTRDEAPGDALGLPVERLRRYRAAMAAVAQRGLSNGQHVDDVVHNAFVLACGKEKSERPDPEDDAGCLAWLCEIVRLHVLNVNRKWTEMPAPPDQIERLAGAEPQRRGYDDTSSAQAALDALSPEKQDLLDQHFLQEKTIAEIAEERGTPYTTTYSQFTGAVSEARAFVEADVPSSKRRRPGASFFPFLLVGMLSRAARAEVAAAWSRLGVSLARSPMRVVYSLSAGALILGPTPCGSTRALPHKAIESQAHAVASGDAAPSTTQACSGLGLRNEMSTPPSSTEQRERGPSMPHAPRRASSYEERSLLGVIETNALRYGEVAKTQPSPREQEDSRPSASRPAPPYVDRTLDGVIETNASRRSPP